MLEFEECEVSGHLRAMGEKGEYWVMDDGAWTYLQRVTPTAAGPLVLKLGTYYDFEEAKVVAEQFDEAVEE